MCSFFVVPGNRQSLLGMPEITTLGILTINCSTIELQGADRPENCRANTRQEVDTTENTIQTKMAQNLNLKISQWLIITIPVT